MFALVCAPCLAGALCIERGNRFGAELAAKYSVWSGVRRGGYYSGVRSGSPAAASEIFRCESDAQFTGSGAPPECGRGTVSVQSGAVCTDESGTGSGTDSEKKAQAAFGYAQYDGLEPD